METANDLVVGDTYAGEITIFMGNGDGTLTPPAAGYAVGGFPWTAPLVDDFSGDGLADIIVPDDFFSLVHLRGYGDGTFRAALSYSLPQSIAESPFTTGVAAADFNGDGLADVVATQSPNGIAPGIVVYLSNPDGTLQPGVNYGSSSTMTYVTVADFNGDGKPDIAATDSDNGLVYIFMGNGDGTFATERSYATDTLRTARSLRTWSAAILTTTAKLILPSRTAAAARWACCGQRRRHLWRARQLSDSWCPLRYRCRRPERRRPSRPGRDHGRQQRQQRGSAARE